MTWTLTLDVLCRTARDLRQHESAAAANVKTEESRMEENSGCAWKVALVGRRTTTMQCGLTRTRRIVLMRFPRRAAIGSKCDWAASPSVRTPPSTLLRPSSCRGYHCQTIALNDRPSIQTLSCLGLRSCRPHQNAAGGRRVVQRRPSSRCSTGGELGVPRDRLLELAGSRFGRTLLRYVGKCCCCAPIVGFSPAQR